METAEEYVEQAKEYEQTAKEYEQSAEKYKQDAEKAKQEVNPKAEEYKKRAKDAKSSNVMFTLFFGISTLALIIYAFYISFKQIRCFCKGTTIGKNKMKLSVINKETGVSLSFGSMLLRESIGKLISIPILFLGYIWILIDKDKQGWHDKLCSSVVVKTTVVEADT